MEFVLAGFRQTDNIRQFMFDRIADKQPRVRFTVGADLELLRKYQISVQELPLLCRRLLERSAGEQEIRSFTFSESEMVAYANMRAAEREETARRRRSNRKPPTPVVGRGWKTAHP